MKTGLFRTRHRIPRRLSVAAAAVFSIMTFLNVASEEPTSCSDIRYLIEQSRTQFLAIQGDTGSNFGDYDATFVLTRCLVLRDHRRCGEEHLQVYVEISPRR